MLEAAFWGFVAGAALLLGGLLALRVTMSLRTIGLVMGFGTGVLISALTFELMREAYDLAGGRVAVLAMLAGAVTFFVGDLLIDRRGGHHRKSPRGPGGGPGPGGAGLDTASQATGPVAAPRTAAAGATTTTGATAGTAGMVLVLGSLLDGIPESAAIGVSLIGGGTVGVTMVVAVFLSNVPEALSASAGLKAAGRSDRSILALWGAVTAASAAAAALGYAVLSRAGDAPIGAVEAFAAGAVLTMLVDTMVPEAVEHAGPLVGLVTALGFGAAFGLSML